MHPGRALIAGTSPPRAETYAQHSTNCDEVFAAQDPSSRRNNTCAHLDTGPPRRPLEQGLRQPSKQRDRQAVNDEGSCEVSRDTDLLNLMASGRSQFFVSNQMPIAILSPTSV